MKSNYKPLGQYIQLVDMRNVLLEDLPLMGLSVSKEFIPSIANLIGTDMRTYKIVYRNQFTYISDTSRRGDKIAISINNMYDKMLVSQAYTPFEVKDKNKLDPEYLMMWFRRPEFDRYARYKSHGSAREIFDWEDMCNVLLPIPHITKQREIVKEYNTIQNRIAINQQLIQKLEETAQAIYREWFVEGIDLENLPEGWETATLNELVEIIDGDRGSNYPSIEEMTDIGYCLFLNAGNVTKTGFYFSSKKFISKEKDEELRKGKLKRNDVVLTTRGTVGNVAFYSDAILINHIRINSGMVIMRAKHTPESTIFIYSMLRNSEIKMAIENYLSGSAQPQLPIKDLIKIPVLKPSNEKIIEYSRLAMKIQLYIDNTENQNQKLTELKTLLLSRMATIV